MHGKGTGAGKTNAPFFTCGSNDESP